MNKKTIILLVLFIVLGLGVFLQEKSLERKAESVPEELDILFPNLEPDRISSIVLGSMGGNIILNRENDSWFVQDGEKLFPADADAIEKAIDTTLELKAVQVVSRNPEKHITFQVNASQDSTITDESGQSKPFTMGTMGTEVTMIYSDGSPAAHFFVGKNGAMDFMTTYVRKADSDAVLLAPGYLKMIYGKGNATAWKNLMLCQIEPETIEKITIGPEENAIILLQIPDDSVQSAEPAMIWKMIHPDRGVVGETHIQRLTGLFRNFRAADFAEAKEDASEYGFDSPAAQLRVKLFDTEEPVVFLFGNEVAEKANQTYLKKADDDTVYIVPKYRLDSIPQSADSFFEAD